MLNDMAECIKWTNNNFQTNDKIKNTEYCTVNTVLLKQLNT